MVMARVIGSLHRGRSRRVVGDVFNDNVGDNLIDDGALVVQLLVNGGAYGTSDQKRGNESRATHLERCYCESKVGTFVLLMSGIADLRGLQLQ